MIVFCVMDSSWNLIEIYYKFDEAEERAAELSEEGNTHYTHTEKVI